MIYTKLITRLTLRLLLLRFHLSDQLQYNNFFFSQFLYYYSTKITIINLYSTLFCFKKLFPMLIFFFKNAGLLLLFDFINFNYLYHQNIYFFHRIKIYQNWVIGTFDNPIIFFSIIQNFANIFEFLKSFILLFTIPKTKLALLRKLWKLNLPIIAFLNSNLLLQYIFYIIPLTINTQMQTFFFSYICNLLTKYFYFSDLNNIIINRVEKKINVNTMFNFRIKYKYLFLKTFRRNFKRVSKLFFKIISKLHFQFRLVKKLENLIIYKLKRIKNNEKRLKLQNELISIKNKQIILLSRIAAKVLIFQKKVFKKKNMKNRIVKKKNVQKKS
jgi:hypothetical protein